MVSASYDTAILDPYELGVFFIFIWHRRTLDTYTSRMGDDPCIGSTRIWIGDSETTIGEIIFYVTPSSDI
jgi:hypothetical protein